MTTSVAEVEETSIYPGLPTSHSTQIYKVSTTQRRARQRTRGMRCGQSNGGGVGGEVGERATLT